MLPTRGFNFVITFHQLHAKKLSQLFSHFFGTMFFVYITSFGLKSKNVVSSNFIWSNVILPKRCYA
jgi:hypothetical protein